MSPTQRHHGTRPSIDFYNNNDDDADDEPLSNLNFDSLSLQDNRNTAAVATSISHTNQDEHTNSSSTAAAVASSSLPAVILQPIYIPTPSGNDTWELTWPIWHMLPLQERKEISKQNGFKSIGDFEESVVLSRLLKSTEDENANNNNRIDNTTSSATGIVNRTTAPYKNEDLYEIENRPERFGLLTVAEVNRNTHSLTNENKEKNGNNSDSESDDEVDNFIDEQVIDSEFRDIENGGLILLLPNELIIYHILPYLPIDQYAICAEVSPHWKNFTRNEIVYKELCKRLYLKQSKRKALHVHRFGGSYHQMLNQRFRVKTGCGMYVLKCSKIKKIQRDMWTEVPVGAILESVYYRYIQFEEDGTLYYALTSKPPHEMIPIFVKMKESTSAHRFRTNTTNDDDIHNKYHGTAIKGTFVIQKDQVIINVKHPWHHVRIILRVLMDGYPGAVGRFWALAFEKHMSSASGDFDEYWSQDLVEYKVPDEPFRFLREWRL